MRLMDIYSNMQNPLNRLDILRKIVYAYATSGQIQGRMEDRLNCSNQNEKEEAYYYFKDSDRFHAITFNLWKRAVVSMSKDEVRELFSQGVIEKDFVELRNYLLKVPDVSTCEEVDGFFDDSKHPRKMKEYLKKYRWDLFEKEKEERLEQNGGECTSKDDKWFRVCSRYIHFKGEFKENKHQLSLNIEAKDIFPFVTNFILECESEGLIYDFKFDVYADHDDAMVIYSSTELLARYIEVLRRMRIKYPELFENIKTPPILTGRIDEKIGYSAIPNVLYKNSSLSFTQLRAMLLEKTCQEESIKWILKNKNYPINSLPLIEILTFTSTLEFLEYLKEKARSEEEAEIITAVEENREIKLKDIKKKLGYSSEDITTQLFQNCVYLIIRGHIESCLEIACKKGYSHVPKIAIDVRGKIIEVTHHFLESAVKQIIRNYAISDPIFLDQIRERVEQKAAAFNIDPNKFCCDLDTAEEFRHQDVTNNPQNPWKRVRVPKDSQTPNQN